MSPLGCYANSVIRTGSGSDRVHLQKGLIVIFHSVYFTVDPVATAPGSDMDKDHFLRKAPALNDLVTGED